MGEQSVLVMMKNLKFAMRISAVLLTAYGTHGETGIHVHLDVIRKRLGLGPRLLRKSLRHVLPTLPNLTQAQPEPTLLLLLLVNDRCTGHKYQDKYQDENNWQKS